MHLKGNLSVVYSWDELRNLEQQRFAALFKMWCKHDVRSECPFNFDFINLTPKGASLGCGCLLLEITLLWQCVQGFYNILQSMKRQDSLEIIKMRQLENYHTTSHLLSSTCSPFYYIFSALENHYFSALTEVRKRRRRLGKKLRNDEQVGKESQKEPEISTKNVRSADGWNYSIKSNRKRTCYTNWTLRWQIFAAWLRLWGAHLSFLR